MLGIIHIDNRRAVIDQKIGEQAQLGVAIFIHRRVIIEVITAEIGKGDGFKIDAVQPPLIETVARCFKGDMVNALRLERAHRLMERAGVRRGQSAFDMTGRRIDAKRTDAGTGNTGMGPDLAHKGGDGGLAISAGDSDGNLGLRFENTRRGARIGGANIVHNDHRNAWITHRGSVSNDGQRAAPNGLTDMGIAMTNAAGQRKKDVARLDPTAIGIQPKDGAKPLFGTCARTFKQLCDT